MSYVVGNADVIKDPFVVEELQRLQAFLKGLEAQLDLPPERPDDFIPPKGPDRPVGVRWPQGPWSIGYEGAGIPKTIPFYSVVQTSPELSEDQHNFAPPGIDSAIMLVLTASVSPIDITGIYIKSPDRRILGVFNSSGATINLISESPDSEDKYRFSWGSSASIGDGIEMFANSLIWLMYDPYGQRWKLFALPSPADVGLPPSLSGGGSGFPASFYWFGASMVNNNSAVVRSIFEDSPVVAGTGSMLLTDNVGPGRTCTTGAVIGDLAGVAAGVVPPFVRLKMDPIWTTVLRTGGSLADIKIWVVLTTAAPTNVDALPVAAIGFRFSAAAGDTFWKGICNSGAAQTVSGDVGEAIVAVDTLYKLQVRKVGSSAFFSVNGSDEVEVSTNLPADATTLVWYSYIFTNTAATKAFTWYRHHFRALLDPGE